MASIDRLRSRRSVIGTIGAALTLGAAGYGSARSTDRAEEPATESARTATPDERDGTVPTDEPSDIATTGVDPEATSDPDATNEAAETTADACDCPG
ncbi:uncharacterized protein Nmag_2370 [Natrialba magadii ATCC 43099]|uniref:Uncharacterized protein n=1 Tax=Natrialba magadii (strain ATCC 43099 / DSM 3394 / CCM 3739 / CIP 104546 / IAM 13178 / JCM 8861 / NBRC 102185 / NCIMB 2190 / MS3) TaxID=547559 RepID=D3SXI3_NATMM|nr:hypothetical protein [Natrialba magadii]ADD05932.1 uncharacterized protein Nmag_2370 [Natrialba magadii ATCC 43099]ELY30561.1 hypothetical protein C500_08567 [Natrialba magadii ATCC 43099]